MILACCVIGGLENARFQSLSFMRIYGMLSRLIYRIRIELSQRGVCRPDKSGTRCFLENFSGQIWVCPVFFGQIWHTLMSIFRQNYHNCQSKTSEWGVSRKNYHKCQYTINTHTLPSKQTPLRISCLVISYPRL